MLSLIQSEVVVKHAWLSSSEFADIVAVSQMTPGPIGINSATYIGYIASGNHIAGSVVATVAVCLPSFILVLLIAKTWHKFRANSYINSAFAGLRLITAGLIASAALLLINNENFGDYKSFIIFAISFVLTKYAKIHPILMIVLAAISGLFLY